MNDFKYFLKTWVVATFVASAIILPFSFFIDKISNKNDEQKSYTQLQIEKTKLEIMILKKQCEVSK